MHRRQPPPVPRRATQPVEDGPERAEGAGRHWPNHHQHPHPDPRSQHPEPPSRQPHLGRNPWSAPTTEFRAPMCVLKGSDDDVEDRRHDRCCASAAVVVDVPRCGPMLSPRVPNLVPIPGPRKERETPGQRPRPNYGHPQVCWGLSGRCWAGVGRLGAHRCGVERSPSTPRRAMLAAAASRLKSASTLARPRMRAWRPPCFRRLRCASLRSTLGRTAR